MAYLRIEYNHTNIETDVVNPSKHKKEGTKGWFLNVIRAKQLVGAAFHMNYFCNSSEKALVRNFAALKSNGVGFLSNNSK